jgi:hypothetical protein
LVTSAIYELSVHSPGWSHHVIGGWSFAGIPSLQSGIHSRRWFPATGADRSRSTTGRTASRGAVPAPDNPSPIAGSNTDEFVLNPPGSFGNAGRNIISGPPFKYLRPALLKNVPHRRKAALQFRAECFDAASHAEFAQPGNRLVHVNLRRGPGDAQRSAAICAARARSNSPGAGTPDCRLVSG